MTSTQPDIQPASAGIFGDLIGKSVGERLGPRGRRALAMYGIGMTGYRVGRRVYKEVRNRVVYRIAVPDTDKLYGAIHTELLQRIPRRNHRAVTVRSRHIRDDDNSESNLVSPDTGVPSRRGRFHLDAFYDGATDLTLTLDGHRIRVSIEREDIGGGGAFRDDGPIRLRPEKVVFSAYGIPARDAVVAFLNELGQRTAAAKNAPRLAIARRWGGWETSSDIEPRALETVILRPDRKEALVADLCLFRSKRAEYERLGIPHHRGYLFEGPPGTGKSSLARALATHVGLDLFYVPLSDLDADTSLLRLVSDVPSDAMLLLEDIDVLHGARIRDDTGGKAVTLSGLLNSLDGVATPSGLITVMTTNKVDALDPALIRPGRADWIEHIGYLDDAQLAAIVELFMGRAIPLPRVGRRRITAADIAQIVKEHMGDDDAAERALRTKLAPRRRAAA